ncbi:MAG: hypothetical protein ACK5JH_13135 [Anaerocolumna sp.]
MSNNLNKSVGDFKLISPTAVQTDTSIAIIWDKQANREELRYYEISVRTKTQQELFDITSYGAVGDGKTLNIKTVGGLGELLI